MRREIYQVSAMIVDANGTFNNLSGYPKIFDSRSYGNDIEKTLQRAKGDWCEVLGAMAKIDTRQVQVAFVTRVSDGIQIMRDVIGRIEEIPDEISEG